MPTLRPFARLRSAASDNRRHDEWERQMSRRTWFRTVLATGAGVATGAMGYGTLYERHALALSTADMPITGLPDALSGLRIGLLTDVHRSQWVSHDDVAHAVRALLAARPDLVVLGGDYVTWSDQRYVGPAADALAALTAPHGVFAVLGNHDDERDASAALGSRGIVVLRDARTRLTIRGETLELAGIRFWTRRASEIATVVKGASGTTLLLAHDPRRLQEAAALGVSGVLVGHTHGGQVVLPGVGAIAARKFPVVAGLARQRRTSLFVSRGLGTVYVPVRFNCPPEVAVVTLRPAPSAD